MTDLTKRIHRITSARRHEQGKTRAVVITLEPPAMVGVRLQGTRQTYWLDAEVLYEVAVRRHCNEIEKRAREIAKREHVRLSTARARARKELR